MRNNNFTLKYFILRITQLLTYSNKEIKTVYFRTFEKIRFFMSFINDFPTFITETTLPRESKNKCYEAMYAKWGRSKTYYSIYTKYLAKDKNFFRNHIWINPLPNYPLWNLDLILLDQESIDQIPFNKRLPIYPLQIFENIDGSFNSLLCLMSSNFVNEKRPLFKDVFIEKFNIINNFNIFQNNSVNKSIKLEQPSIFETYSEFIDNYIRDKIKAKLDNTTFNFSINFKKKQEYDVSVDPIKNKETIKMFNLNLMEGNNFGTLYSSRSIEQTNPYRILFKNRYSFPDFNPRENFILRLKKKKNKLFEKTVEFFKLWTYQSLVYELKDKIQIQGFLSSGFNYDSEFPIIKDILDNLETDYIFLVNNINSKQSTLSLYSLPSSNQFLEVDSVWELNETDRNLNIKQKEDIIAFQINQERLS